MKDPISKPMVETVKKVAADPTAPSWIRYVAMLTGTLAAVAGYLTVRSAVLTNNAIYSSNQGVLFQAKASDKWTEYEADSVKANMSEMFMKTVKDPDAIKALSDNNDKFRQRQPEVQQEARDFEQKRDDELKGGTKLLAQRDILSYAGMAIQLGIALASVAALTRRYDAFVAGVICGVFGVGLTAVVMAMHFAGKI